MSVKKKKNGDPLAGMRTFVGIIVFVRMTFKAYQRNNRRWFNPFQYLDAPGYNSKTRDILAEDEVVKLFVPGAIKNTIEPAVCAAMFL